MLSMKLNKIDGESKLKENFEGVEGLRQVPELLSLASVVSTLSKSVKIIVKVEPITLRFDVIDDLSAFPFMPSPSSFPMLLKSMSRHDVVPKCSP